MENTTGEWPPVVGCRMEWRMTALFSANRSQALSFRWWSLIDEPRSAD
jgi:hypothetical protein